MSDDRRGNSSQKRLLAISGMIIVLFFGTISALMEKRMASAEGDIKEKLDSVAYYQDMKNIKERLEEIRADVKETRSDIRRYEDNSRRRYGP